MTHTRKSKRKSPLKGMTLKSETTSKEVHADLFKALSTQAISMYAGYNNVLGKMSGRNKNIDIENALKLAASDGQITYNEIRQNLKKYHQCLPLRSLYRNDKLLMINHQWY